MTKSMMPIYVKWIIRDEKYYMASKKNTTSSMTWKNLEMEMFYVYSGVFFGINPFKESTSLNEDDWKR